MSLQILELMEGARNCVKELAKVQPGQNVLILTDTTGFADPLVTEAIALVAKEAGADVTVATSKYWDPRVDEAPKIVANALYAADVLFDISCHEAPIHCRAGRIAMLEYGTKLIPVVANNAEIMSSEWARFPVKLYWAIYGKVWEKLREGKTIRVVSTNGTDISAGLRPAQVFGLQMEDPFAPPKTPPTGITMFKMFPPGVLGVHPLDPANGIIVYDALLGFKGLAKEPIRVTVENHWVTNIEGGEEARWFRDTISEKKSHGIEADYWSEIMWGLNPKASLERGLAYAHLREAELTRRAGTLHFGIGKGGKGFHWDGILIKPFSVFVDGDPVIEDGRLKALDDPQIREMAREYGDPDQILSEVP